VNKKLYIAYNRAHTTKQCLQGFASGSKAPIVSLPLFGALPCLQLNYYNGDLQFFLLAYVFLNSIAKLKIK